MKYDEFHFYLKDVLEFVQRDHSREKLLKVVKEGVERIETTYGEKVESVITDTKYGFISGALKETYKESPVNRRRKTEYIDAIVTHKLFGFPIFLLFLYIIASQSRISGFLINRNRVLPYRGIFLFFLLLLYFRLWRLCKLHITVIDLRQIGQG